MPLIDNIPPIFVISLTFRKSSVILKILSSDYPLGPSMHTAVFLHTLLRYMDSARNIMEQTQL